MHKSVTVLAAAAALTVTLAGCANPLGPQPGTAAPAPAASSAAPDPKIAFASAFAAMGQGRVRYSVAFDESTSAIITVDNDTRSTHAAITVTEDGSSMTIESYQAGDFLYTKMDLTGFVKGLNPNARVPEGFDGKKWLRLDPSRSEDLAGSLDEVALDPKLVERSVLTIEQRSAHTYRGTMDLTRMTPARFGTLDDAPDDQAARELAKNVPFLAETDSEGRISVFSAKVTDGATTSTMTMNFSQWGTAQLPPVPGPGSYIDAPDAFYDMGSVTA